MRIALFDYAGKGKPLAPLLEAAGHEIVEDYPYDLLLLDCDFPWAGDRVALLEQAADFGARVAVYPHGGNPQFFYDGLCTPHPDVDALLVTGPGHLKLQRRFGHRRVIQIGWYWCDQQPLNPIEPGSVLFAPLHPWGNGVTIAKTHRDANIAAYDAVCGLGLPVTVRYLGDLDANGLEPRPGVTLIQGDRELADSVEMIDRFDLIVGADTFAHLALARGKQVVMIDQQIVPHDDYGEKEVSTFSEYAAEVRYPLAVGDAPLAELAACARAGEGEGYRARFVGPQATVESIRAAVELVMSDS